LNDKAEGPVETEDIVSMLRSAGVPVVEEK
jgi:hypothetical protein